MSAADYVYTTHLAHVPFDQARGQVIAALAEEGFGVLTEIDVQATLKKKLDVDYPRYRILGACNPQLAYQVLQEESPAGALLPCNVVVEEDGESGSLVRIAKPRVMFAPVQRPDLEGVAAEADARLQRVLQRLQ